MIFQNKPLYWQGQTASSRHALHAEVQPQGEMACTLLNHRYLHDIGGNMVIQGLSKAFAAYAAMKTPVAQRQPFASASANIADTVSISDAAKAMFANSQAATQGQEIQNRLDAIKVQGVFFRAAQPLALINGKTLQVGDRINGVEILAIHPGKVTLAWAGEQRVYKIK